MYRRLPAGGRTDNVDRRRLRKDGGGISFFVRLLSGNGKAITGNNPDALKYLKGLAERQ